MKFKSTTDLPVEPIEIHSSWLWMPHGVLVRKDMVGVIGGNRLNVIERIDNWQIKKGWMINPKEIDKNLFNVPAKQVRAIRDENDDFVII